MAWMASCQLASVIEVESDPESSEEASSFLRWSGRGGRGSFCVWTPPVAHARAPPPPPSSERIQILLQQSRCGYPLDR